MTPTPFANDLDPRSEDVRGFGYGEHLLIWTIRRLASGRGDRPAIARVFAEACGEDGGEVLATTLAFLTILAQSRRTGLTVGYPSSLALTHDEQRILGLIAAAQSDHAALLEAHLIWLASETTRQALGVGARAVARALSAHALYLPLRPCTPPPVARSLALVDAPSPPPKP